MSNKFWTGPSKSDQFLLNRNAQAPLITPNIAKSISSFRKEMLASEVEQGMFRDGNTISNQHKTTAAGNVMGGGIKKQAQVSSSNYGGSGGTVQQAPSVYSPLWLDSNMSLPRDRATVNAWCRSFFALNPFVRNAISLHSTYPISKLNIKCPNKEIEKFFNDMIEETDLMNVCVQIAQEYWLLGEAFVYAEYDGNKGKWSRLVMQNPDYMIVNKSVVADDPVIMMRPDENLKKIIFSNKPSDVEQRKQLSQNIIESVKRGGNIPLNNFNIHHLANKISPHDQNGTGLPVAVFKQLMLFDRLRECYSEDTEVLTKDGFKFIKDLVHLTDKLDVNGNFVNGVQMDGNKMSLLTLKDGVEIACVNNDKIEYHKPIELHMSKYVGEMYNFESRNYDISVTPNHKMWASKRVMKDGVNSWNDFDKVKASEINNSYKFAGCAKWEGKSQDSVSVLGKEVPIELYLKVLAYVISEGWVSSEQHVVNLVQNVNSDCFADMKDSFYKFAEILNKNVSERICKTKDFAKEGFLKQPSDRWSANLYSIDVVNYFKNEISSNTCLANDKFIPTWVKELNIDLLKVFLNAIVSGDGSHLKNKDSLAWRYYTCSKKLADDVQEIAFKCGYAPIVYSRVRRNKIDNTKFNQIEYTVSWSNAVDGQYPAVKNISKSDYDDVVWCFEVPTGLFITRRNGKMTIQGNSKYAQADSMINPMTIIKVGTDGADGLHPTFADLEAWRDIFEQSYSNKDFKIFTHAGLTVEKVGSGSGIYDISGDITQLIKEIYIGLQVPSVLMDGGADTSYANGGVALDMLRQRYLTFRNKLSAWLKMKIFAPISKIQEFYEYTNGEKQLIVPDIDWNHMSLFDTGDYINQLVALTSGEGAAKRVSVHTLYRSLGLEFEDEARKMRKEAIQAAIMKKEAASLEAMDLNELRALDEESEIPEEKKDGDSGDAGGALPGMDAGAPGAPGADAGMPPPPPPPA